MSYVNGVNLLPATGEFSYATTAHRGQRITESSILPINLYQGGALPKTDFYFAIDQLQVAFPACQTAAVVCAWFGDSTNAAECKIYPSSTYIGGAFQKWNGSTWVVDHWKVSGLTEASVFDLIPISRNADGKYTYGGTPSDQSIVECITHLKAQGFRVVFYPFILMDDAGKSWRGRISYSPDMSSGAATAVSNFLGSAVPVSFTQDFTNKTVAYSGSPTDFTYRRMILHYANLCVIAGGVDLFLIGSELRGLETIRGPAWTAAGTVVGGFAAWDYPFVGGLIQLADDVRAIFDAAGLFRDLVGLHNLISYAADWSDWMGYQHPDANPPLGTTGQWPHLDPLWSHSNIDLVCFDNYLPISDWTTGDGSIGTTGQSNNLDIVNWAAPAAVDRFSDYGKASAAVFSSSDFGAASSAVAVELDYGLLSAAPSWPPGLSVMSGLGLTGTPTIYSKDYLKANIEGGEKFNWFYFNSENLGRGLDPLGSDLSVSLPDADRLTQTRHPFLADQQILGNKQLRWWWHNRHYALYDTGSGDVLQGPHTAWVPQSKSIVFTEYGFPASDRCTNQPNLFYDASSSESGTAFWSVWRPADGMSFLPKSDQILSLLAFQAIYEYWFVDGYNAESLSGLKMIEPAFCSVWNWDARPFPAFPNLVGVWADAGNWQAGNWLNGKGPFIAPPVPDAPFVPGTYPAFPTLSAQGWSVYYRPTFSTAATQHVSGRSSRSVQSASPVWEIELVVDLLRMDDVQDFQALAGFYAEMKGQDLPFTFPVPATLGLGENVNCRFADDSEDLEEFMNRLWTVQTLKLRTVRQ